MGSQDEPRARGRWARGVSNPCGLDHAGFDGDDAVARIHDALDRVLMERCGVRAVGGVCGRERGEHLVFDAVAEDRVLDHLLGRRWGLACRRDTVVALWGAGRCAWAIRARRAGGGGGRSWRGVGTQSVSAALPLGVSGMAKMRSAQVRPSPTEVATRRSFRGNI